MKLCATLLLLVAVLVGCGTDDRTERAPGPWPHPSNDPGRGLASPLDPAELAFTAGYRPPPPAPPELSRRPHTQPNKTTSARASRSRSSGCSGWADLVGRYPWPVGTACAVLACESGGNPNARNRTSSAMGLMQVLGGSTDPETNLRQAFEMWSRRGWQPWAASRSCWG